MEIWSHYDGYNEARRKVETQSLDDDLHLLDDLFGRGNLQYGATDDEVKKEALRQLEIEWRKERSELAEMMVIVAKHTQANHMSLF